MKGYICLILTNLIWGISFVSMKVVLDAIPPMLMTFYRFSAAAVILVGVYLVFFRDQFKITKRGVGLIALLAFLGVTLNFYFENNAVMRLSAGSSSILYCTLPLFTVIAERIFLKRKIHQYQIIAIAISLVGVLILLQADIDMSVNKETLLGYGYMVIAMMCWSVYSVYMQPITKKYGDKRVFLYQMILAPFLTLPFLPAEYHLLGGVQYINAHVIIHLLVLILFASVVAFYTYLYAVHTFGGSYVALSLNLVPFVTIIAGGILLGEKVTPSQILGGAIIISAVVFSELKKKSQKKKDSQPQIPHKARCRGRV